MSAGLLSVPIYHYVAAHPMTSIRPLVLSLGPSACDVALKLVQRGVLAREKRWVPEPQPKRPNRRMLRWCYRVAVANWEPTTGGDHRILGPMVWEELWRSKGERSIRDEMDRALERRFSTRLRPCA